MDDAAEREANDGLGNFLLNYEEVINMTKEEVFREIREMEPVLGRGGKDVVLGEKIVTPLTMGYFFNEEIGMWEVYACGERSEYFVHKQTGSEQETVEDLYGDVKYEYKLTLRHLERERQRKERMQNGQK